MKLDIRKEIELTEGVSATVEGTKVVVKGPNGEVSRTFNIPKVKISLEENKLVVFTNKGTKREKTKIGTTVAHLKNMVKGVVEPFEYELKICSGHFPMNVAINNNEIVVKNYLGEKVPRTAKLKPVDCKVQGDKIVIKSPDKELAGQTASKIEQLTRITNRDRRIFQDGIFIVNKGGKAIK